MKNELVCLFTQEPEDFDPSTCNEDIAFLPWRSAKFVFDQMQPLFDSEVYSMSILKGLITSSGGLTESTVKAS